MNRFSIRFYETRRKHGISAVNIRNVYEIDFGTRLYAKQYKAWESGVEEPPLHFIAWFCKKLGISGDYILGLSDHITSPSNLDELLFDLTPDQRSAIDTSIKAFRAYNAVNKREA